MKKEYVELNADSLHSANLASQSQGRNLDTNEIVQQLLIAKDRLTDWGSEKKIRNIV